MIFTVKDFCRRVSQDLTGLTLQLEKETYRYISPTEKEAWKSSYPAVSAMLKQAMQFNPEISHAHISISNLLLEYKLPGSSSWCDVVLLGKGKGKRQVVIIELKDWQKNNGDKPGEYEGLICHKNEQKQHPSDQVKGYTEYCQYFHSAVVDNNADVSGCVYFTQEIDLTPYTSAPNKDLVAEYPVFNINSTGELAKYVAGKIETADNDFLVSFETGVYKQNRNILIQVAENLKNLNRGLFKARPFVLLQKQREGFLVTMNALRKAMYSDKKQVIIVEGPPGSGKSAVAVNLWIEAVLEFKNNKRLNGNVVYVTTSGSQNDNWDKVYRKCAQTRGGNDVIVKANSFNPGMTGTTLKKKYLDIFWDMNARHYLFNKKEECNLEDLLDENPSLDPKDRYNDYTLRYDLFREYLDYLERNHETKNYKRNLHFLSIVDEAHALINPTSPTFKSNKSAGWCVQMGPQAWHVINESQVSVFFTDGKQSFRDNETTSVENLYEWAKELGAEVIPVSLDGQQYRCGGSTEFVEWLEKLFTCKPINNHNIWKEQFEFNVVDYPSEVEDYLRAKDTLSKRLLSTYTVEWVSSGKLDMKHSTDAPYDFVLKDKNGKQYYNYWNYGADKCYDVYVQARTGSKMSEDPLCEIGCPYTVRGFDYDYVGVFWLDDIVRRNGKWIINSRNCQETAIQVTRKRALDEQCKKKGISLSNVSTNNIPSAVAQYHVSDYDDKSFTYLLFSKIAHSYRILLTRGIKGACLYIQDEETRNYVKSLL